MSLSDLLEKLRRKNLKNIFEKVRSNFTQSGGPPTLNELKKKHNLYLIFVSPPFYTVMISGLATLVIGLYISGCDARLLRPNEITPFIPLSLFEILILIFFIVSLFIFLFSCFLTACEIKACDYRTIKDKDLKLLSYLCKKYELLNSYRLKVAEQGRPLTRGEAYLFSEYDRLYEALWSDRHYVSINQYLHILDGIQGEHTACGINADRSSSEFKEYETVVTCPECINIIKHYEGVRYRE